jgi:hypothetical protein
MPSGAVVVPDAVLQHPQPEGCTPKAEDRFGALLLRSFVLMASRVPASIPAMAGIVTRTRCETAPQ